MSASGWIGVDLDGTLAEYHGWNGGAIGPPIPAMLERVRAWLSEGTEVRIFTARVFMDPEGEYTSEIQNWCEQHLGVRLKVTCQKDYGMIELWDDRCVQVVPNKGTPVGGAT